MNYSLMDISMETHSEYCERVGLEPLSAVYCADCECEIDRSLAMPFCTECGRRLCERMDIGKMKFKPTKLFALVE